MANKKTGDIEIGGRLFNTATGNIVAGADAIKDEAKGKTQAEINVETYEHVAEINAALQELSPDQTEALALATDVVNLKEDVDQGAVFDVSAKYPTSGVEGGNTYTLEGALAVLNANLHAGKKKGGMSIKFVQSSDNKYVQFRCMADEFTTDTTQWAIAEEGVYVENPEYTAIYTDAEGKIILAIENDGNIHFGAGVPQQVIDYINEKIAELSLDEYEDIVAFLDGLEEGDKTLQQLLDEKVDKEDDKSLIPVQYIQEIDNPEFVKVWLDNEGKVLFGLKSNGDVKFGCGFPSEIQAEIQVETERAIEAENALGIYEENPEYVRVLTDSEGKVLCGIKANGAVYIPILQKDNIDAQIAAAIEEFEEKAQEIEDDIDAKLALYDEILSCFEVIDDPEGRIEIKTDSEQKIISYRDGEGVLHESVGIETTSLSLTGNGLSDFASAIKNAGYSFNGYDWSEKENIELPEPKHYSLLNIVVDNLPINDSDVSEGYVEYYDGLGNYFKLTCELAAQGQTSRIFARTGGKGNYTLDLPKDVKFGDWVPQDSFHLKGCAKDVTRSILPTSYKWAYMFMKHLDAKPNRVLMDESAITLTHATGNRITDWPTDARCLPDGFPVEVYINGEYWGLYSWQLKKHRKNYSMDKKDYTSFFIDADYMMSADYQHGLWNEGPGDYWTHFEIKNPKDLVCMDGTSYDGDHPKELIDSTSQYYDASDKKCKGSAQTKALIINFSTRYLEVKGYIDNNDIVTAKEKFNEYFDYNSCMFVYIYNCLMKNADSIRKNTLWAIYGGGKIAPMLWDLDGMYGQGWIGNTVVVPSSAMWDTTYANAEWPLGLFWTLYEAEIKAAYAELRENKIISVDTWKDIVFGWNKRVGQDAYERDIKKWPETPSYRENYTNTDYWTEVGVRSDTGGYPVWNDGDSYAANDNVVIKLHAQSTWYMRYKAVQANIGVCPVTQFYKEFPVIGGFYDSPKRWEKWMEEQIRLCDVKMGYSE